ncbi:hypothetical protein HDU87_008736 [Geranomyces variabilis]|uniref:Uncharacterized protein n=1 Tax=Geranomyces variabilis TaxID=109894 RepID=A0AAD5TEW5_9FUNG|nr:hypothetical protein HDU87_008736 [Geranomyces variabilis]
MKPVTDLQLCSTSSPRPLRNEYNGHKGNSTEVRTSRDADGDANSGVMQFMQILKNGEAAVQRFVKSEVQKWKDGVEAGTILLENTGSAELCASHADEEIDPGADLDETSGTVMGVYDIEVVKTARKHKFPFSITHRLSAKKWLPNDFFTAFMDKLNGSFNLDDQEEKRMCKAVALRTIGCLGTQRLQHHSVMHDA